ncbi:MAG: hypothetical protein K8T90_03185 [Planctomycetes bacterium]|nr:hypothetical protein [Planctomycetota bacterium]
MARIKEESTSLLADLTARLERMIAAARAEGREDALREVRALVGGAVGPVAATAAAPVRRGPGRPRKNPLPEGAQPAKVGRAKSKKPRRNPWADLTPEQRLARVNAIRKGRGLPTK